MASPENEIIETGLKVAIQEAKDFLKLILGPPLEEIGGILQDQVRFFRLKNQISILKKTNKILVESNVSPKKVKLKLLFPLLDYGSLEEEESMLNVWATLLANASNPKKYHIVNHVFPEFLKQMTSLDVLILDQLFTSDEVDFFSDQYSQWPIEQIGLSVDNLFRLGLLMYQDEGDNGKLHGEIYLPIDVDNDRFLESDLPNLKEKMKKFWDLKQFKPNLLTLTNLGRSFVKACRRD